MNPLEHFFIDPMSRSVSRLIRPNHKQVLSISYHGTVLSFVVLIVVILSARSFQLGFVVWLSILLILYSNVFFNSSHLSDKFFGFLVWTSFGLNDLRTAGTAFVILLRDNLKLLSIIFVHLVLQVFDAGHHNPLLD